VLEDEGAEFSIYLPALSSSEAGFATADGPTVTGRHPSVGASITSEKQEPRHILYLDDDTAVLILVKRLLERRGYRVSCFSNQHEALDALRLRADDFHVVVTDYNMPGMQGLEVAREVRAIRADLPVAVTSGFIDEELQQGAKESGVRQLISKPFAIEDFYLLMETL
jgi:CheY-like chemotaxis protein